MPSPQVLFLARAISRLLGWTYTLSWSLSFYPQPLLNIRRRSTVGSSLSYPTINTLSFFAYLISTSALYASPLIRSQYAARNPVSPEPTVRANDVAFAAHAAVLCVFVWSMYSKSIWGFEQGGVEKWRMGKGILGIIVGCIFGVGCVVGLVLVKGRNNGSDPEVWAWIDVVYAAGFVKLVITSVKYVPQVMTNYNRKSTVGWSIVQIVMDIIGGVLSILQLVIDSSLQNDWSGIINNPVKLGLGAVSILFDLIFLIQHYVLYPVAKRGEDDLDQEESGLLSDNDEPAVLR